MPVMRCYKNGMQGYKWGAQGTCYVGPGAKEKAEKQAAAIQASRAGRGKSER